MAEPAPEKLKVFISYSRRDSSDFAEELVAGLEAAGFAPFLDRHDISAGEDWEKRLSGLIAESDTVVFVVSPQAVTSEQCVWEIDEALKLTKRLLPVVHKPVPPADLPPKLGARQYVDFHNLGFGRALNQLSAALRQDLDWVREHTRLGELAARWSARGKADSLLLRGDDLDAAKAWAASRKSAAPEITDAQRAFLAASEEAESARLSKERAQLEEMRLAQAVTARSQRRAGRLLWGIAALVLLMIGYVTWQGREVAKREIDVFTARASEYLKDEQYDRAMRYALQGYPVSGQIPWLTAGSPGLEAMLAGSAQSLQIRHALRHVGRVVHLTFNPDSTLILAVSDTATMLWDTASGRRVAVLQHENVARAALSPDGTRVLTEGYPNFRSELLLWDLKREVKIAELNADKVLTSTFNADGRYLITVSPERARLWRAEDGREIKMLDGDAGPVRNAVFSPDGKAILTSSADRTARIWDVETRREIVLRHTRGVSQAQFSPDGKRVMTETDDGVVWLWNAVDGASIGMLGTTGDRGYSGVFSPDSKSALTWRRDGTVRIWNSDRGDEIRALSLKETLDDLALTPDGKRIITKSARLWTLENGSEFFALEGKISSFSKSFSSDGKRAVTFSGSAARLWNLESGYEIAALKGHAKYITNAIFSPDDRFVATGSVDGTVRLWNATLGGQVLPLGGGANPKIWSVSFSPDGKQVVAASADGKARIFDARRGHQIRELNGNAGTLWYATFSPDNRQIAATSDNQVLLWDVAGGDHVRRFEGRRLNWQGALFSPDSRFLLTATSEGPTLWEAKSGTRLRVFGSGKYPAVSSAAFSPDGKRLATGYNNGMARLWNTEQGTEMALLEVEGIVHRVAFSPDGQRLATASSRRIARVWNGRDGSLVATLEGHSFQVVSAVFSPDGMRVATAAEGPAAWLWDAEHGHKLMVFDGHRGHVVYSAEFGPDGRRLVTAGSDGTIRLWDRDIAIHIAALKNGAHGNSSSARAEFSPDGGRVVAVFPDETAVLWDVTWATLIRGDELRERVCAEKLVGAAQDFTDEELTDPILRGIDPKDPVARNPCLRRGPLSLDYWTRLPGQLWRSASALVGAN